MLHFPFLMCIIFLLVLFFNYSILPAADPVTLPLLPALLMLTQGASTEGSSGQRLLGAAGRQHQGHAGIPQRLSGTGEENGGFPLWDTHGGPGCPSSTSSLLCTFYNSQSLSMPSSSYTFSSSFVPLFPSLPLHEVMQYSTDLELILASVPSPAPFGCPNSPSYPSWPPRFPPKLLIFPPSLCLSTLNTFQPLLTFPSSSFLSSYTLSPISQTGPILSHLHLEPGAGSLVQKWSGYQNTSQIVKSEVTSAIMCRALSNPVCTQAPNCSDLHCLTLADVPGH